MKQFFAQPLVSVTVTEYKRQVSGRMSDDGLGYVWQCNVFSHYVLVSFQILGTTHTTFVSSNIL